MSTSKQLSNRADLVGQITKKSELIRAIKLANFVYVQARYQESERWLKLSKTEARYLIGGAHKCTARMDEQHDLYLG